MANNAELARKRVAGLRGGSAASDTSKLATAITELADAISDLTSQVAELRAEVVSLGGGK